MRCIMMVLLTAGLVASEVGMRSGSAQERAPREILLSEQRLETLKGRVEQRTEPTYSAWRDLQADANAVYQLALCWRMTGDLRTAEIHRFTDLPLHRFTGIGIARQRRGHRIARDEGQWKTSLFGQGVRLAAGPCTSIIVGFPYRVVCDYRRPV
jgi:hypothetical protein